MPFVIGQSDNFGSGVTTFNIVSFDHKYWNPVCFIFIMLTGATAI